MSGLLTDEEREAVRNMAYAGSYSQEKAARYVRTVEAIIDVHDWLGKEDGNPHPRYPE